MQNCQKTPFRNLKDVPYDNFWQIYFKVDEHYQSDNLCQTKTVWSSIETRISSKDYFSCVSPFVVIVLYPFVVVFLFSGSVCLSVRLFVCLSILTNFFCRNITASRDVLKFQMLPQNMFRAWIGILALLKQNSFLLPSLWLRNTKTTR